MKLLGDTGRRDLVILSIEGNLRSRTNTYLQDAVAQNFNLLYIEVSQLRRPRKVLNSFKKIPNGSTIMISSPNSVLAIHLMLLVRRRAILDAGWPLIDGVLSSRKQFGFLGIRALKTFVIDFLAFHFSTLVFLESCEQIEFVRRRFLVRKSKLRLLYTGFNERRWDVSKRTFFDDKKLVQPKRIIFRGGNQPEAGLDTLSKAIKLLENSHSFEFIIITKDFNFTEACQSRISVLNWELSDNMLFKELASSHAMLGQLSNHRRLSRTLPHKFFEAAYLGLPYITSMSGIMEFFVKNKMVVGFEGGNPSSLSNVLNESLYNMGELEKRAERLHEWYRIYSSQKNLSNQMFRALNNF